MTPPLITLTTDFGRASPYVAVMKGVILSINPKATIIDLSNDIRAQDVLHANYFLGTAVPYFPAGAIHLCVVDPGVGSDRRAICAKSGGHLLVGPDNGIFSRLFARSEPEWVRELAEPAFWRTNSPSNTFHGRDVFAPVAAHLSLGIAPERLGEIVSHPVVLQQRSAVTFGKRWSGEVQFVDDFGNLITNIPACKLKHLPVDTTLGGKQLGSVRWVRTYSEAAAGELVCLFSSDGFLEIAVVNGNAAQKLAADLGAAVELEWH